MKKKYLFIILLYLISFHGFAQDCLERNLSDDTICIGQNASIILPNSEITMSYQLRIGTTDIATPIVGTGSNITFNVSPATTTDYSVFATSNTSSICTITYVDVSTVTVNTLSVAPTTISGTTTICNGQSTTLTVSGGSQGTEAITEWFSDSCGGTSAGTGNSITVSPTDNTTYYVRYKGTCNTTTCTSATVTVNTLSVAPTVISGVTTICNGQSTTLTVSGGTLGTGAVAEWFSGSCGGTFVATGNSITVSPSADITYYVRYKGTCNSTTCASATVTVNTLSVTPTTISGTTTICNGQSTTLTVSGGTLGTGAVAEWFSGSCGGTFVATGTSITVSPSADITYYVRYKGTCNTTTCASATVTVNSVPTPTVTIGVSPGNNICAGTTVTFTATPTNGGSSPSYQWKINNSNVGTDNFIFTSSTLSNTDKVTVVLISNATCASPINATSNQITMTVNDLLTPSVSISASAITICPGNNINFSAVPINGGSTPSYQWNIYNSNLGTNSNVGTNSSNYSATTLTDGDVVTVELTSNAICVSPNKITSNSIAITVKPATPNTPLSISGTVTQCPILNNQIYTITAVADATIYNWAVPSGWTITGGQGTTSINVTTGNGGQNGNISVTAGNDCGTSSASTLAVTVNPNASIASVTGINTICISGTATYTANSVVLGGGTGSWSSSNAAAASVDTSTGLVTGIAAGTSNIIYTITGGCSGTKTAQQQITINPNASITSVTGTSPICISGTTNYSANSVVLGGGTGAWSSTNTAVATVNPVGQVTGIATGTCDIIYTITGGCSGTKTAKESITVTANTSIASVSGTSPICISGTTTYSANSVVLGGGTGIWSSSNTTIATVDPSTGIVTGVTAGTSNIIYTISGGCSGTKTAQQSLSITPNASIASVTGTSSICISGTTTYSANSVVLGGGTGSWSSSNTSVATVNPGTGIVTGVAAGTSNIIYTISGGCSGIKTAQQSITITPNASIVSVTGTSPICISGTTTYSANSVILGGGTGTWSSSNTAIATVNSSTGLVTGVTAGTSNIIYTITGGCSGTKSAQQSITINPNASIASVTGTGDLCTSTSTTFTANSVILGGGTGAWSSSNNSVATVNASGLVTATGSGTCNIIYTITSGCGGNISASKSVNVFSGIPTTPGIPIAPAGQSSSLCPAAYGLMYSISAVGNATSYNWNVPAGWTITSGQGTTEIVVDAGVQSTGSKNISVTATNACGSSTSPNYTATVGTFGYVDAGIDQVVCAGTSSIALSATGGGSTNINNDLTWSAPSGSFSNSRKANAIYTINNSIVTNGGSVTLTATVRAEGSCPVSTDQMIITVLPPVTASIGGTTTICSGSTTNITFNATPNTTVTYTASGFSGSSKIDVDASGTKTLTTPVLSSSTTYTLTSVAYTALPTCDQAATGSAVVTVNPAPIVNAAGPDTVCQSSSPFAITLSGATISGGAATAAWSITSGGGSLSSTAQTATPASVTYTPAANYSGTVTLTLITNAPTACSSTSAARTITVNALPAITGALSVCEASTTQLSGSASPAAVNPWTSSNTSVATVSNSGLLSGIANGTSIITYTNNNGCKTTATITVNALPAITGTLNVCEASTTQLSGSASPAAVNPWTSSNTSVATISNSGLVSGIVNGTSVITYTNNNGCKTTATITVNALPVITGALNVCEASTTQLSGSASPAAVNPWTSSNTSVATVSNSGLLSGIASGTSIITYTNNNGCKTTATITINALPTITGTLNICEASTTQLSGSASPAVVNPWTSSNTSVATVSNSGLLSGIASGTSIITYTNNNGCKITATITVNALPTITGTLNVCEASTTQLSGSASPAVVNPWISSNTSVATVSNSGLLSGIANGTSIITYTNNNGCKITATITVNAFPSITGTLSVCEASTTQLNGSASPAAVNPWISSNTSVATVSNSGLVSGIANGTSIITYTNNNGCKITATITVNAASAVNAGSDQTICQSGSPAAIALTGASVGGGATTGTWSITSGGGTLSSTAQTASPATITYRPASNYSGTVILKLTTNSATSCSTVSATKTFTVKKEVIITTQPYNISICASFPADLNVVAIGDELTYQWYKGAVPGVAVSNSVNISGAQSSNLHFNQASLSDDGIYYIIVSGASACSAVTSAQRTLNVDQAIIVSTQPISQSICSGANITLTVGADASGDMLSFQWRKNGSNIGTPITSAATSSLVLNNNTATATYDVLISGPSGYTCSSVQSATATVTVYPIPTISGTLTVCEGATTQLSGSASANASSPWSSSNTSVATVSNIGLVTGIVAGTTIITYTNSNGCKITATVTVNQTPNAVVTNVWQTICSGTSITPMIISGNVPLTSFNWTRDNTATVAGIAANGSGNISGNLINTNSAPTTVTFTITTSTASCIAPSIKAQVLVNPTAQVNQPSDQVVCNGSFVTAVNFGTTNTGGTTSYSWTNDTPSIGLAASGSGNISPFATINNGNSPIVATITVTPTFTNGGVSCTGATKTFTITVNPKANVTKPTNIDVCNGNTVATITFGSSNSGGTKTYTWTNTTTSIGLGASGTGNIPSFTALNTGTSPIIATINVTPTYDNGGIKCNGQSETFVITVNPTAQVNQPINVTICNENTTSIIAFDTTNTTGITTYNWTNNTPSIGLTSGSGSIPSFIAVNAGATPVTATITVSPSFNNGTVNCSGPPKIFTVTVNPTPTVAVPSNITVCNQGTIPATNFTSSPAGGTYTWTNSNPSIGLAASGTGNIGSFTATNTGTTAINATITVTPTVNGCIGISKTYTIKIEASSNGGVVAHSDGTKTKTDCHSASGQVTLTGYTGSVLYWETSIDAGNTWTNKVNNGSPTYTYSSILTNTLFRAAIQNASCEIVKSDVAILFIIPNIKPSPVNATPSIICEGDSTILSSSASYSSSQNLLNGGLFNTAQPEGWYVDGGNFNASGDNGNNHTWLETNGNLGTEYDTASNDKFAIVRGAIDSRLETPIFDLVGLTSANLTFETAYQLNAGASGTVELSFDGGATYKVTLITYSGNQTPLNKFNTPISIPLDDYLGYSNLRLKFNFHGTVDSVNAVGGSSWAIDNVKIPQAPVPTLTSQWQNLGTGAIISVTNATNVTVSPTLTTTYAVTSFLNGCTSYGVDGTTYVTVTVNKRPTANIGPNQTICYGGTATFNIALTGKAPWIVTYTNGTTPTTVTTSTNPYVFSVANLTVDQTYTVSNLSDANCTVALPQGLTGSAVVDVLTGAAGVWTGLVSTDWFDCKNWEQGLPSYTVDALIPTNPSGGPTMPIIDRTSPYASSYSFIASARDITIANGASVTMVSTNNSELQISRNWKNSGVFTPGTGTVTFNGGTANQVQTINLGIKTNETFYNLTTNNVNGAKGISLVDAFELMVFNDVTLISGDIRLTGQAQLVQAGIAANSSTGSGKLLRDQKGKKNSFNYNYWSSPVSPGSNTPYVINTVLRDGTDVTTNPFSPTNITFGSAFDFADSPNLGAIQITDRWIWSYNAQLILGDEWATYYQWYHVTSNGTLKVGEGYTMKGTGGAATIDATQNYTFIGKPNSGTITLNMIKDNSYLIGNPYPSALDADEFIKDNIKETVNSKVGRNTENRFSGVLYFWDHFGLSNNHYLAEYQGGYATYSLAGGVVAINNSPLNLNDGALGSKAPGRYIPVAQGFFIVGYLETAEGQVSTVTGGPLLFKNSQRAFVRENTGNSVFMKKSVTTKEVADDRYKIRLGFDSSIGAHRQLLVTADTNTSNQFDIGYDAPMLDTNVNDMFWYESNAKLVIQAVPNFNDDQIIAFGLVVANEGDITIKIDALENIPNNLEIYLHDNITGIYHDIKNANYTISMPIGEYNDRFSLQFVNKIYAIDKTTLNEGIMVYYTNNNGTLNIKNNFIDATVTEVDLFNLLGQKLTNWKIDNIKQNNIQIPIKNVNSGMYLVKIKTTKGDFSKKIIIK
jgi:uncharacterized protein YjdB